jgi:arylsulfatase A-like enzyme/Flp pilus assembly protein TadD
MKKKAVYLFTAGVILALIAAAVLLLTGSRGEGLRIKDDFNLLIITLDTMRADRVGAYGCSQAQTPHLDSLAQKGVMFENCYAPVPVTLPAHCSLFTGRYPLGHRVRDNGTFFLPPGEVTLAEQMKARGYRTFAAIGAFVLLAKFGLNQGFDVYDDSLNIDEMVSDLESEIKADRVYEKFNRWFRQLPENEKFFAWVHFYDPHTPYEPPPQYRSKFPDDLIGLYDGEVAFTDLYVGKIIDDLKTRDRLSRTLVVVVGDHGEAFGEHREFGHSLFCYQANLKVPLIFFNPELFDRSQKISCPVNLIDILPTVLELYGREIPREIQGTSLVPLLSGAEEKEERAHYIESMHGKEAFGWAPLTGIIAGRYKYISLPEAELYDLSQDPGEKDNLFWKKNRLARGLDRKLLELVNTYSEIGSDSKRQLSDSDRKHLETLGYISTFSSKKQTAVDPKRGILFKNRLDEIEREIAAGNLKKSETLLKRVREENPGMILPQYFGLWDTIYLKRDAPQQVIANWREAVRKFPDNHHLKINLASELFSQGQLVEAQRLIGEIIKHDPQHTAAYILGGRLEERRGRSAEALRYFEKALELEPANVSLKVGVARLLAETQQLDQAGEICREILKDKAVYNHTDTMSKIGIILTESRQDELAFRILSEAVKKEGTDARAWNYLGILYFRQKDFDKALSAYRKSIDLAPRAAVTHNNLATLYLTLFLKQRQPTFYQQAMTAYNTSLELDPNLVSALNGRGSAHKFANRINEALGDWKKAILIKPDFTDAYLNLGVTYLQLGARAEALKYLSICREKYLQNLSSRDRDRLNRLIKEAGGSGQ